ncbi:Crossover junction endodeoxyribonuclease ruvC [Candidatus Magnetomorum sp. HK-1]|nr:Crossover junction endodeoxyribonuclease ruvC [Candidatus Magnetomorum sp. HK-1]
MKVIGIDPGLASTGVGMVRGTSSRVETYAFSTITTSKTTPLPKRLQHIYLKITDILTQQKPDLLVVEDIFSLQRYPKSGITLAKVSGVILLAASHFDLDVTEIPVREAKKIFTGSGSASKQQLEKAVRHLLGRTEPVKPNHASDALALGMIGIFRGKLKL